MPDESRCFMLADKLATDSIAIVSCEVASKLASRTAWVRGCSFCLQLRECVTYKTRRVCFVCVVF